MSKRQQALILKEINSIINSAVEDLRDLQRELNLTNAR